MPEIYWLSLLGYTTGIPTGVSVGTCTRTGKAPIPVGQRHFQLFPTIFDLYRCIPTYFAVYQSYLASETVGVCQKLLERRQKPLAGVRYHTRTHTLWQPFGTRTRNLRGYAVPMV